MLIGVAIILMFAVAPLSTVTVYLAIDQIRHVLMMRRLGRVIRQARHARRVAAFVRSPDSSETRRLTQPLPTSFAC